MTNYTKTQKSERAAPFMVRLHSEHHKEAFKRFCKDNLLSMDAQAAKLIEKRLIDLGYIKPSILHKHTQ